MAALTRLVCGLGSFQKQRDPEFAQLLAEAEAQAAPKRGRKGDTGAAGSRRRKTEKEEDAELLNEEVHDADDDSDAPFVFTESPSCTLPFSLSFSLLKHQGHD